MLKQSPAPRYEAALAELRAKPALWLVTGCAGFIGSHLIETLLLNNQQVIGLDNFATGTQENLDVVRKSVGAAWNNFSFIAGDITKLEDCKRAVTGVQYVLHQAALGSVPRSIAEPLATHNANVTGFINMLEASRLAQVHRFVYASSSSVYGDAPELPKVESKIGSPLSPYALSKLMNEQYAAVFARCYGFSTIGLRYFNVFGPRQAPNGPYAAVCPKWLAQMKRGERCEIFGDGETSRDFCHINNAVQANILAAVTTNPEAVNRAYNVSVGGRTSLNALYAALQQVAVVSGFPNTAATPEYRDFRSGDVRHSQASIELATSLLGYAPTVTAEDGLKHLAQWFFSAG